jgi:hypothetical protein
MSDIQITLSDSQVGHVVKATQDRSVGEGLVALLDIPLRDADLDQRVRSLLGSPNHAQSVLRALQTLVTVPEDAEGIAVTSLPPTLGISSASAHRYLNTWRALGVITQDLATRRYRRVTTPGRDRCPGRTG